MKIAILCATQRGLAVLKRLTELVPTCELVVFSFREEANEPRFFESIRDYTLARRGTFVEAKRIGREHTSLMGGDNPVDLTLVVSWRYLLPEEFCRKARLGTFVFHDSLLPAYRGFSPTVWAMINGETETGVTLFEVTPQMDAGKIIAQKRVGIGPEETIGSVIERVTTAYLHLLEQHLPALLADCAPRRPQDHSHASYTCRRLPCDNQIDWGAPTKDIFNLIRAVTAPYPGAFTWLGAKKLFVWSARLPVAEKAYVGRVPGRVVEVVLGTGAIVLTGDGSILLTKVQLEGGEPVCAAEILNRPSITVGAQGPLPAPDTAPKRPRDSARPECVTSNGVSIPFNRSSLLGRELEHIFRTMTIGQIAGDQTYSKKCQNLLEEMFGVPRALVTTSCTHALEMSALLLDIQPGDEVIVPSFTFVSTANAFALRGARIIFADIRPDTLNLDESRLEELITERTKAIVPVHYAGIGCEMDTILEIANRYGIAVVEDNAHGLFGKYRGRWLGTFGCLASQSFHETKNITCGEGGALLINDPVLIERAEIIREKGTDRSRFFRGQVDKYSWVDIGSSYVMSDVLAAFLYAQFEVWETIQARRRRIWEYYDQHLREWARGHGVTCPVVPPHCEQSYHMYYLLMPSLEERQALISFLKARGVLSVFHYLPLHLSPVGRSMGGANAECAVTEETSDRIVRLPFYNSLEEAEQGQVIEAIRSFRGPKPAGTSRNGVVAHRCRNSNPVCIPA